MQLVHMDSGAQEQWAEVARGQAEAPNKDEFSHRLVAWKLAA
jgi:hypothetical protein